MHKYLKNLKKGEYVDSVYLVKNQSKEIIKASNGNKYIVFKISDASLENLENASLLLFFDSLDDVKFLNSENNKYKFYLKINGKCVSEYPNIKITSNRVVPANEKTGIVFDTSNLYPYNEYFKNELLSYLGKQNVPLRHTSSKAFQNDFDLIDIGTNLKYERVKNSIHDKYQINVFIDYIDDVFNIPAYLTPTMGKMIDDGYKFQITVSNILPSDEEKGIKAGIRVNIKARI